MLLLNYNLKNKKKNILKVFVFDWEWKYWLDFFDDRVL